MWKKVGKYVISKGPVFDDEAPDTVTIIKGTLVHMKENGVWSLEKPVKKKATLTCWQAVRYWHKYFPDKRMCDLPEPMLKVLLESKAW